MTWGVQRVALASDVPPGQQYTFTFPITAPAAGTYTMQWQMMQRWVEWFGGVVSSSVTVGAPGDIVTYIHTDGLGSPVARTDSAGNLLGQGSRTSYEPYGRIATGATPTIGFTGHMQDADTGLVYMQQRYYDPVAGRFLSIDPVTSDSNTGSGFNRYIHAKNNPYKYIDPDGRQIEDPRDPFGIAKNDPTQPRKYLGCDRICVAMYSSDNEGAVSDGGRLAGVGQGIGSYFKGLFYDFPKAALELNGVMGSEKQNKALASRASVIDALALIRDNPNEAMRIACLVCMHLSPSQEANLQGRLGGRLVTAGVISTISGPVGAAASVGALTGNLLSAGVNVNDKGAILRSILFGEIK